MHVDKVLAFLSMAAHKVVGCWVKPCLGSFAVLVIVRDERATVPKWKMQVISLLVLDLNGCLGLEDAGVWVSRFGLDSYPQKEPLHSPL